MNNGENSTPGSGLSLAPNETDTDNAAKPVSPRSRTEELLANSSLSLVPVEEASAEPATDESASHVEPPTENGDGENRENLSTISHAAVADESLNEEAAQPALTAAALAPAELPPPPQAEELPPDQTPDANETAFTEDNTVAPAAPLANLDEAPVSNLEASMLQDIQAEAEVSAHLDDIGLTNAEEEISADDAEPVAAAVTTGFDTIADSETTAVEAAHQLPAVAPEEGADQVAATDLSGFELPSTERDGESAARLQAIAAAEEDAAALFGNTTVSTTSTETTETTETIEATQETPVAALATAIAVASAVSSAETTSSDDVDSAVTSDEALAAAAALALAPTDDHPEPAPTTGKAVFEAKPVHGQQEHVLDIPPPPVKKPLAPAPVAEVPPAPIATATTAAPRSSIPVPPPAPPTPPVEADNKPAKSGLFGKIGEWKGHLNYLHSLYKEDPNSAVAHWKQTYKERDAFADAIKDLQERQHADNFAWEEIPRVLGQFHLREDDRGQADWYGDAARQYQQVLNAIEKQKTFKPQLVQPLMKELKFIAEADAFHQKFGLTAVQQRVKTMYQTLQQRIDEYMKLQKQQLEVAVKDKEVEKLRAQEAIATAEAQKVAQENRLVQEQRLKVVEDKKRLEVKRAAEEAERVRLERQREIEAEQAEVRRREELSASFRAIEQEELMRKALQNMSLSQCAEGLMRQLFEKDQLSDQEKAAAARVLDVLKAKLG